MGKRRWRDWFSQRVGWYYGLIMVYIEGFDDVLRVSRRRLGAGYHFLLYTGVFALLVHPLKLVSLVLVLVSLANGLDDLTGLRWVPDWEVADPVYFLAAYSKYFLLVVIGLFAAVPREDRLHLLSSTPIYFFYAFAQLVPITVGYLNWFSLRWLGGRVFRDHYQDEAGVIEEHRNGIANGAMAEPVFKPAREAL